MNLFVYKMALAPLLVAGATLAGRRWGDAAAGLVAGFPIVAGPILFFYALEQGPLFASNAALATLLGLISLSLFILAYCWRAKSGGNAFSCLILGWVAFALSTILIQGRVDAGLPSLPQALFLALLALFLARKSLPAMPDPPPAAPPSIWDLPMRMLAAAALVLLLTRFAQMLGPRLGGLLTPFPVASAVLSVFAQSQGTGASAVAVLKGMLLALNSFAAFCATLVLTLPRFSLPVSFALGLGMALGVQGGVLLWRRRQASSANLIKPLP